MKKIIMWEDNNGNRYDSKEHCAAVDGLFKCPKCHGIGSNREKYNAYPSGLPDSGWVYDWKYRTVSCTVCNGEGYTVTEKKVITKIVGYE